MLIQAKITAIAMVFMGVNSLAIPVPSGAEISIQVGPLETIWSGGDIDFAIAETCPTLACPLMEIVIDAPDGPDWRIRF